MNKLDMIIIGISALATVLGLWKGLVRQIVTLAGVVLGYFVSLRLYEPVAKLLPQKFDPGTAKAVSFVLIFVICIIMSFILGVIVGKLLKIAGLGWANRLGGGAIGFLKGFIIIAIIVTVLIAFLPANSAFLENSVTLPYVLSGIRIMGDVVPHDIREKYQHKILEIRRQLAANGLDKVRGEIKNTATRKGKSVK